MSSSKEIYSLQITEQGKGAATKLLHVMILYLKALFEYALWPVVFDCTVRDRYGTGTGQVRGRYGTGTVEGNTTPSTALMTAKKE